MTRPHLSLQYQNYLDLRLGFSSNFGFSDLKSHIGSLDRGSICSTYILWSLQQWQSKLLLFWRIWCCVPSCSEGVRCSWLPFGLLASLWHACLGALGWLFAPAFCLLFLPGVPNHAACRITILWKSKVSLESMQSNIIIRDINATDPNQ